MNETNFNNNYPQNNYNNFYPQRSFREELAAQLKNGGNMSYSSPMQSNYAYNNFSFQKGTNSHFQNSHQMSNQWQNQAQTNTSSLGLTPINQPNPFNTPYNPSSYPSYSSFTAQPYPNYSNENQSDNANQSASSSSLPTYGNPSAMETLENMANGIYQGFTGGYIDEIRGLQHGLVYGIGDMITGRGDGTFSGGFSRGYKQKRDEYRQAYEKAQLQNPKLTALAEINGAVAQPGFTRVVNKVAPFTKMLTSPVSKNLPLAMRRTKQLGNAGIMGGIYGFGAGEGDWDNQLSSAIVGSVAGRFANKAAQTAGGRVHFSSDLYSDNLVPTFVEPVVNYYATNALLGFLPE